MTYKLGPVKPHVQAAAEQLGPMFGFTNIGGWRPDPLPDHPGGVALDFMIDGDKSKGDALAAYAQSHAAELNITYIIWYRRIWSVARASEGWRNYTGTSNPHTDHVHISFQKEPGNVVPTGMGILPLSTGLGNPLDAIQKPLKWVTNSHNWIRVGLFVGGFIAVLIGIMRLVQSDVTTVAKVVGKVL